MTTGRGRDWRRTINAPANNKPIAIKILNTRFAFPFVEAAAVTLDVSHSSPLIQKLYQATREIKEPEILARLGEAKKLLADGADVKATDQYGRTALHWTVFGSSYNTKPNTIVSYEEMAEAMQVSKGTIMSRLFHARQKLQKALADCYAEENEQ